MNTAYLKIGMVVISQVLIAGIIYALEKKTAFGRINRNIRQIIIGLIFGGLAICGTEYGIPMNGAQINCRDAAVLIAGLMFGAPAGIIAGVIGSVERWIAVAWGIGTFTRVACTVSTLIAGFYSAALRKYMFEDKKPGWLISGAIGVVMEVFHMTMVFLTNLSNAEAAMVIVRDSAPTMIIANGISVMLAAMVISMIGKEDIGFGSDRIRISQTIQRWLLIAVIIAFLTTSLFVYGLQNRIAEEQASTLVELAIEEMAGDVQAGVVDEIEGRRVGLYGFVLVYDSEYNIVSAPNDLNFDIIPQEVKAIGSPEEGVTLEAAVNGEMSYCRYRNVDGYGVLSVMPDSEVYLIRNVVLYVNTFMEILVFAIMFGMIYQLIKRVVVNRIKSINESLGEITNGNLSVVVDVRSNEEFASLSDDINSTVDTLKRYIDEASARIDKELEFAKEIQASALPNVFPAFPKRRDFDIYALMDPAKEVGGDFYDFYMTGSEHDGKSNLNFVIADVSGKGIPAAMFMMRAKTELKSLTETDMQLCDVFTNSNAALCEGNDAGMFVTAWQGGIDLSTGLVKYANAGHNPPLVRHKDGSFEYLKSRAGFVLAGMEGLKYKEQQLQLAPGDIILLYTDGVTEATNAQNELYGEERLLNAVNTGNFADCRELCQFIKSEVDSFVGDAPQFDDITLLAFKYIGTPPAPSIHFDNACFDDIPAVTEFMEAELEKMNAPMKAVTQISIAIDEIYSNIVRYAYTNKTGPATVELIEHSEPHSVSLRFTDEGVPYNPIMKEDPDVTLSAEERGIGGLGIFMVKKSMDDMHYEYRDDKNIFTVTKKI